MADDKLLIHLRFANDGTVSEIGGRPDALSPQAWFDHLSAGAGSAYQALSGGRGVFRLTPGELDSLATSATATG